MIVKALSAGPCTKLMSPLVSGPICNITELPTERHETRLNQPSECNIKNFVQEFDGA